MALRGSVVALCVALALATVASANTVQHTKHRHHLHHRHHLRKATKTKWPWSAAAPVKPATPAAKAVVVAAPLEAPVKLAPKLVNKPTAPVVAVAVARTVKPRVQGAVPAAVKQLKDDLEEVKQMRGNVGAVEKALEQEVSLLRETATLQRMSTSAKTRADTQVQLHQTEQVVKEMEAMVLQGRKNAMDRATAAMREASAVKKAADALGAEASMELQQMKSGLSLAAKKVNLKK